MISDLRDLGELAIALAALFLVIAAPYALIKLIEMIMDWGEGDR